MEQNDSIEGQVEAVDPEPEIEDNPITEEEERALLDEDEGEEDEEDEFDEDPSDIEEVKEP